MDDNYVARAMEDAAVVTDARGLMSIQRAREIVSVSTVFARGAAEEVASQIVLDSDRLWAALLSLEDGAEFVRAASRLSWEFQPRGHYNVAPAQRYGDAIEEWLLSHVDGSTLRNVPWCVKPCLLEVGTAAVFRGLWALREIMERSAGEVDSPAGEGLADPASDDPFLDDPTAEDRAVAPEVAALLHRWIQRHSAVGFGELARLAVSGDARAREVFEAAARRSPAEVASAAESTVGADAAQLLFLQLEIPAQLEPAAILGVLDLAAEWEVDSEGFPWPMFRTGVAGHWEYHALRVTAARSVVGDQWGILFERITGGDPEYASVDFYRYGSNVPSGMWVGAGRYLGLGAPEGLQEAEGQWEAGGAQAANRIAGEVLGPEGVVLCVDDTIAAHDLRPGHSTESTGGGGGVLTIRAYLAHFPHAFWSTDEDVLRILELPDAEVVCSATDFAHVTGHAMSTDEIEASVCRSPSESVTYRSLAQAICDREATAFVPGQSNTDWRLHAAAGE